MSSPPVIHGCKSDDDTPLGRLIDRWVEENEPEEAASDTSEEYSCSSTVTSETGGAEAQTVQITMKSCEHHDHYDLGCGNCKMANIEFGEVHLNDGLQEKHRGDKFAAVGKPPQIVTTAPFGTGLNELAEKQKGSPASWMGLKPPDTQDVSVPQQAQEQNAASPRASGINYNAYAKAVAALIKEPGSFLETDIILESPLVDKHLPKNTATIEYDKVRDAKFPTRNAQGRRKQLKKEEFEEVMKEVEKRLGFGGLGFVKECNEKRFVRLYPVRDCHITVLGYGRYPTTANVMVRDYFRMKKGDEICEDESHFSIGKKDLENFLTWIDDHKEDYDIKEQVFCLIKGRTDKWSDEPGTAATFYWGDPEYADWGVATDTTLEGFRFSVTREESSCKVAGKEHTVPAAKEKRNSKKTKKKNKPVKTEESSGKVAGKKHTAPAAEEKSSSKKTKKKKNKPVVTFRRKTCAWNTFYEASVLVDTKKVPLDATIEDAAVVARKVNSKVFLCHQGTSIEFMLQLSSGKPISLARETTLKELIEHLAAEESPYVFDVVELPNETEELVDIVLGG